MLVQRHKLFACIAILLAEMLSLVCPLYYRLSRQRTGRRLKAALDLSHFRIFHSASDADLNYYSEYVLKTSAAQAV
jgi:hypothetical protein